MVGLCPHTCTRPVVWLGRATIHHSRPFHAPQLEHHLIEGTVLEAVAHSIIWHPDNPSTPEERAAQRALARRLKKVADLVVETRPDSDKFVSMEAGTRI